MSGAGPVRCPLAISEMGDLLPVTVQLREGCGRRDVYGIFDLMGTLALDMAITLIAVNAQRPRIYTTNTST